jgi:acyl dehydratase
LDLYFDDFNIGDRYEGGSHTVTREEILAFAKAWDPQPFHLDDKAAKKSPFGTLVASGWHTAAISMKLVVESGVLKATGVLGVGVDELRWPKPVYPGDTLRLTVEVVEKRLPKPDAERGILRPRLTLHNQHGEVVFSELPLLLVARRP